MNIGIVGNMGVGKSTLCKYISSTRNMNYISESESTNPFLVNAYSDRSQYNLMLQMHFLFQRYSDNRKNVIGNNIFDRTFFDGPEVFVRAHLTLKNLDTKQAALVEFGYKALLETIKPPDLMVFLNLDAEIAYSRLIDRADEYKNKIDKNFLSELDREYLSFFERYDRGEKIRVDVESFDLRVSSDCEKVADIVFANFEDVSL